MKAGVFYTNIVIIYMMFSFKKVISLIFKTYDIIHVSSLYKMQTLFNIFNKISRLLMLFDESQTKIVITYENKMIFLRKYGT